MARNKKIGYALVVLALIAVIAFIFVKNRPLPGSFTITAEGDLSSAAASRSYEGTLTFSKGIAIAGDSTYISSATGNQNIHTECDVKNGEWVIVGTETPCTIFPNLSPDKAELKAQIKDKTFIEAAKEECPHLQICYRISR